MAAQLGTAGRPLRVAIIGAGPSGFYAAGAFLGAAFGWVVGNNEPDEEMPGLAALGPGDYFQLGISILTLARQFGSMIHG